VNAIDPLPVLCSWPWIFHVVLKIAGLLFTGLALAFGAPFWFDMLSKLVRLRASGEKPLTAEQKKAAEASPA
jgi:hypothetical protein